MFESSPRLPYRPKQMRISRACSILLVLVFVSRDSVVFLEQAERELACLHCLISQAQAFIHCAPPNLIDRPKNCQVCRYPAKTFMWRSQFSTKNFGPAYLQSTYPWPDSVELFNFNDWKCLGKGTYLLEGIHKNGICLPVCSFSNFPAPLVHSIMYYQSKSFLCTIHLKMKRFRSIYENYYILYVVSHIARFHKKAISCLRIDGKKWQNPTNL